MDAISSPNGAVNNDSAGVRQAEERQDGAAVITSDFETFLRLMTTQLQNQDPLNPMDSSDLSVQLATFSGVEQQVQTNELLRSLLGNADNAGISNLADWVGRDVRTPSKLFFDGTSLTITPPIVHDVDRAILVATDAEGAELSRNEIPNDGAPLTWLGVDATGTPLPAGTYSFKVEGYRGNTRVSQDMMQGYGTVLEVQIDATGEALLILESGAQVRVSDVTALRETATDPAT